MEGNGFRTVSSHFIVTVSSSQCQKYSINVVAGLEQYSVLTEKNNGVTFLYSWLLSAHD